MSETSRTDQIRQRAHELYVARQTERQGSEATSLDDWLTAEKEVADRLEHQLQAPGPDELEMAQDVKGESSCHK